MKTLAECLGILRPGLPTHWLEHPGWMGSMNEACAEWLRIQGWIVTAPGERPEPAKADSSTEGDRGPADGT